MGEQVAARSKRKKAGAFRIDTGKEGAVEGRSDNWGEVVTR